MTREAVPQNSSGTASTKERGNPSSFKPSPNELETNIRAAVRRILTERLGTAAPFTDEIVEILWARVVHARDNPPQAVRVAKNQKKLQASLLSLRKLGPTYLAALERGLEKFQDVLSPLSHSSKLDLTTEFNEIYSREHQRVEEFRNMCVLVDKFAASVSPRRREADARSAWHSTAQVLLVIIEMAFEHAKMSPPSAKSVRSGSVLAVCDLLKLAGIGNVEVDAVRKAIAKPKAR